LGSMDDMSCSLRVRNAAFSCSETTIWVSPGITALEKLSCRLCRNAGSCTPVRAHSTGAIDGALPHGPSRLRPTPTMPICLLAGLRRLMARRSLRDCA
jgi:hypothetical protein